MHKVALCSTPLCHPIRSNTKTNHDSLTLVFPHFATAKCIFFEFWLVHCFVIGQSDCFGLGFMALNWKSLHSDNLPLHIKMYLCVTVFGAFAKQSKVPSSAPNTSSRPGRPGNRSALTAPDSTVLPTLISSVQRSLPRMIAIWPSTRGIT